MIFEKCLHFKRVLSLSESFLVILFVYSQTSLQSGQYITFKNGTQKPPPLLAVTFVVLLENSILLMLLGVSLKMGPLLVLTSG